MSEGRVVAVRLNAVEEERAEGRAGGEALSVVAKRLLLGGPAAGSLLGVLPSRLAPRGGRHAAICPGCVKAGQPPMREFCDSAEAAAA